MKLTKRWIALTAAVAAMALNVANVNAAHVYEDPSGWWSDMWVIDRTDAPKFAAQELSLDLFASYTTAEDGIDEVFESSISDGDWGGGVGLNYFLTRHIGIGGDLNIGSNDGKFIDQMFANVIFRLPIESIGLAPYIIGGIGGGTEPDWEWLADAGAGLELRFNRVLGIFSDARYVWADRYVDRLVIRGGLRVVF